MPPYYLKNEGKLKGTYIRIGSNNRMADESLIAELERKRRNVSFDSEIVLDKTVEELNINGLKKLYKEKTEETLDIHVLKKLELIRNEQGKEYPTNALILFSDDALRSSLFPNAKIECARFKGTGTEDFIDQKSITGSIGIQAEEAYNFVLRHINKGAKVEGIYTVSRWEYPIKAIRYYSCRNSRFARTVREGTVRTLPERKKRLVRKLFTFIREKSLKRSE